MQKVRINDQIRTSEVRVIDEGGEMLGVMKVAEALELARSKGLDLIEVSPKAQPPVVKILSFDKFRYQQEKVEREQRKNQKRVELKGVRVSVRIGEHDMKNKANQAKKFLEKGNKVKIDTLLRGRERANIDYAFEVIEKFLNAIECEYNLEQKPKKTGHMITTLISPVK